MKKILLGLSLLFTGFLVHAQTQGLENIIVEKYYVSDANDALGAVGNGDTLPPGSVTYRIYADMLPGYKFQAAYGVPTHTLVLSTTTSFYNNTDRGHEIPSYSKTNAAQNTTMLDSWFSAGAACTANHGILKSEDAPAGGTNVINANGILLNNDPSAGIPLTTADGIYLATPAPSAVAFVGLAQEQTDFDGGPSSSIMTTNNGSWASLVGASGPTANNKVLIGQFTTNGCFSFQLNIQIGTPTGGIQNYVAGNATGNEIYFPGCTYPLVAGISTNTGSNVLSCPSTSLTLVATGGGTYLWDNASTNVLRTVTSAGTYTVVVSGGNGCTSSVSTVVTSSTDATNPTIYLQSGATLPGITGPSTAQTPYVQPAKPGVQVTSILTANESVGGYKMSGIPDGTGAFDNGNGTFTLLVNHEIPSASGVVRAHGSLGAYVSKWIINKNNLSVVSGSDLMQQAYLWNGTSHVLAAPGTAAFNRFCSADLPPVSAFYNINSGKGTTERIFMNGEEGGVDGRAVGHIVTGLNAGKSYQLPYLGKFAWENSVASPFTGDTTLVAGMDDGTGGQVYFYIGSKTTTGNEIDKAGLNNGKLFGVVVSGFSLERVNGTTINNPPAANTPFSLVDLGVVANLTGTQLNTNSVSAGVTSFSRPEDGAWDPSNPNDFYFATTDQYDQVKDGIGSQVGRTRIWKLSFTNVNSPQLGGTITAVLDGTEAIQMIDNMCIDNFGHLILQEDVGNQQHNGKIWQYNIATDQLTLIAKHDEARFGNIGVPATSPYNLDEESSGVIDASSILGPGMFLAVDQAHSNTGMPADVYENGQIFAFFNPESYGAGTAKDTVFAHANSACTATGVSLGIPATADNCSVASVTSTPPVAFPIGNTNVLWTVTDGSSNSATATQVVVVLDTISPPTIAGSLIVCAGGSSSLSVGTFTSYNWSTGATTQSISVNTSGTYGITVTKSNGCTASTSVTFTVAPVLTATGSSTNISCFGSANGTASVLAGGGTPAYSYLWSTTAITSSISGLSAGTYTVTVTDSEGCTETATVVVNEPAELELNGASITDLQCNGDADGEVDLSSAVSGGTTPYSFLWSNAQTTSVISGLIGGTYSVTITDASGCTLTASYAVTEPTAIVTSFTQVNVACFGASNGSIDLNVTGGTLPYVYDWSNNAITEDISGLVAGVYQVAINDDLLCAANVTVTITEPLQLVVNATATNAGCAGVSGSVTSAVNGGTPAYLYLWSNAATTTSISGLSVGTYTFTVTDANGCTASSQGTVIAAPPVIVTGTVTNIVCKGTANGSVITNVSGGTSPYSYLWNNGNTNANRTALGAGTFTVTVTDASGCTKAAIFTITQPATGLFANTNKTNVRCGGSATGVINVAPFGGTSPYTYLWNTFPVQTTAKITGLSPGVYSCTYTDAVGCAKSVTVTITAPSALTGVQSQTNVSTQGGNDGTASVVAGGGTPAYSYSWYTVPVKTTATITGLTAGIYKVKVTDSKGCTLVLTYVITQPLTKESNSNSNLQDGWNVSVFPNPSTGFINAIFNAEANEFFNISLSDLTGRVVYEVNETTNKGENQLFFDFNNLSKGVYMMKFMSGDQQKITKIVLQ